MCLNSMAYLFRLFRSKNHATKSHILTLFSTNGSLLGTLANSEDPDVKPHDAAFHQGLCCWLSIRRSPEKGIQFYFEIVPCDPNRQFQIYCIKPEGRIHYGKCSKISNTLKLRTPKIIAENSF